MINKVLIANRGEIACRIIKTAKKRGIKTVAVYSHADQNSLHVHSADESVYLGESLQESYLNSEKIISAAKKTGSDAIHPGYGFLAENPEFARQCDEANLIFIGPPAHVIKLMGHKDEAKKVVESLGISLLPGYHGDNQETAFLKNEAKKIGFPVLLKAAGGGGGKGMRIVTCEEEFDDQLAAAKRESLSSFGFDKIIIEKYLKNPRHIEVQIAADQVGNVVHLFERDCSIQRRYQKIIEEAPAYSLSEIIREKLYASAVQIAKHIAYVGVGTLEYLVEDNQFYFMEMNTRLQVEHPVTELITQQDLVEWQFSIANKKPLPLKQDEIKRQGHAIEARLCAEDPEQNYLPASGKLHHLSWPENVRIDTGVQEGDLITVHYDSLLAKIIVYGNTRDEAIQQFRNALDETDIIGITTNRLFLKKIASLEAYWQGNLSTQFIPKQADLLNVPQMLHWESILPLVSIYFLKEKKEIDIQDEEGDSFSPWNDLKGFKINLPAQFHFYLYLHDEELKIALENSADNNATYLCKNLYFSKNVLLSHVHYDVKTGRVHATVEGVRYRAKIIKLENNLHLFLQGWHHIFQIKSDFSEYEHQYDANYIRAPIPGNIVAILVKENDVITKGQALMVIEAMKMEHTITAPKSGKIQQIHFQVKDQIEEGTELLRLSEE